VTTIAELFVSIGIKGSDKTLEAFVKVQKGLEGILSTSFQTKAAILGIAYALEQLGASAGETGIDLTNFEASTGVSTQVLERYTWAAKAAGVTTNEMAGTFKSLQSNMAKTLAGQGAPSGMARVAMQTMGITKENIAQFEKQPEKLIQILQKYALSAKDKGLARMVLDSFGIGGRSQDALFKGLFNDKNMADARVHSSAQLHTMEQVGVGISKLKSKFEFGKDNFITKFGPQLLKDIDPLVDKLFKLAGAFEKLSEKAELMRWIGKAFEGWTFIFTQLTELLETLTAKPLPQGVIDEDKKNKRQEAAMWVEGSKSVAEAQARAFQHGIDPALAEDVYREGVTNQVKGKMPFHLYTPPSRTNLPDMGSESYKAGEKAKVFPARGVGSSQSSDAGMRAGTHEAGGFVAYFADGGPVYMAGGGLTNDAINKKGWKADNNPDYRVGSFPAFIDNQGNRWVYSRWNSLYFVDTPEGPAAPEKDYVADIDKRHYEAHKAAGGPVGYYAGGGGPKGHDTVPAWLDPREYVLTAGMVQQVGVHNLEAWRKGGKNTASTWIGNPGKPKVAHLAAGGLADMARPSLPSLASVGGGGAGSTTSIQQTLNFQHPGTNARETGDSVKKAVSDAFRSLPQSQAN